MRNGLALSLLLAVGAMGCATDGDPRIGFQRDLERDLRRRGLATDQIEVPFSVSEEMKAWVRARVPSVEPPEEKLKTLLHVLVDPQGLGISYRSDLSLTAREAFRRREANCLGFTNLFVGLARELGVDVRFLEVKDLQSFSKEGDLVIEAGHVTAVYGDRDQRTILEFTLGDPVPYRSASVIADTTAIAMYYTNRGARLLRDGHQDEAQKWLQTAIALDPDRPGAWVNLGVARRRSGDFAGAEAAYRKALEADPQALAAHQNLAALLRHLGKEAEALELLALIDRRENRNPFGYLELGDLSLKYGRIGEAERFYRRAMRLNGKDPEICAALGLVEFSQGHLSAARRWLRKAHALGPAGERVTRLEHQLAGA